MKTQIKWLFLFLIFSSCSTQDENGKNRQLNQKAEFIYRTHQEYHFSLDTPKPQKPKPYPFETQTASHYPPITKEYFRCKGSSLNPVRHAKIKENIEAFSDCGGFDKHSLPLRDGKEFIYPILIDLLNYLQTKTGKRVVITCGHRCPEHNTYSDPEMSNQYSKHMIGAEVSFYVQGMEEEPEKLTHLIQDFYKDAKYTKKPEFTEFKTYDKEDTNVSTPPIYNKEIFVKVFKKNEGRNFDNRHPYPYISIQVRYDCDKNERVVYSWKEANQNFLRK